MKPRIAITMGDPAGVGPELCLRARALPSLRRVCAPVLFGDRTVLERAARRLHLAPPPRVISIREWNRLPRAAARRLPAGVLVDCAALRGGRVTPGRVSAACGRAAAAYVAHAARAARAGRVDGIATAPLHKEALRRAGIPYAGHTEMLAALTGARRVCMMMASETLRVSLATIHVPLSRVAQGLTRKRILDAIELTHRALRALGCRRPRILVCGLNPHAGEGGLFGREERTVIAPAVAAARARGYRVTGPVPPDTAFLPARRRNTDAYVAMYHDQALIPFKMLSFETGVNVTLGLPIVRTSVDHGTAFDIAWQGKASPASLVQAVLWAARLSRRR